MTGEREDLYEDLSEIAPTVGYYINTNENWDYYETSPKVAEIFNKRGEMKKDLDRVDAKEAVFEENVKAKFGSQNLCIWAWLTMKSVTMLTGILVTCMILISSIVPKPYNPDDMFQVIDLD